MSTSPDQMQQMLAYYKAQFPGQIAAGMGNAPVGTNSGAGAANGMSKLLMALMQQNAMKKYQQQYGPKPVPQASQGQTLSAPTPTGPGGQIGVPDQ